ncbi:MAG TPA: CaiB/BaiF CoA-transferase family protein [Thermomicrobiales bacterium]|nr:CaiB/BaiF CoA-transferase family protein [Thermomicrobiales bacterium]
MSTPTTDHRPLAGIRVVDLTRVMTGPYCTMMLGDLGADVIKIEHPGKGDDTRAWGPPFINGEAAYYLSVNRNKRSIAIDLKSEAGKEIVWKLIDGADVLVENFSPGTVGRLGFGWEAVHARNPRLVMASISGFGQHGPGHARSAYDLVVQGMGGIMSVTGERDGMPTKYGVPIGDIGAGMFAAYGIAAALVGRGQTGEGQYVDVSMLGGQIALLTYQAASFFATGEAPKAAGNAHSIIAPYDAFPTADGYVIVAVGNDSLFQRFCGALGMIDAAGDDRFMTNRDRIAHNAEMYELINAAMAGRTTAELVEALDLVGVPCGPISTVDQVFENEQVLHTGQRRTVQHPTAGEITLTGFPYAFSGADLEIAHTPPMLGEQTRTILGELGYDEGAVAAMFASGAVAGQ